MTTITDPACELAEIAKLLSVGGGETGDKFLANKFQVEPWSTEFVRILACIFERCDLVADIVDHSSLDEETKASCREDMATFKSALSGKSLWTSWNTAPDGGLPKIQVGSRFLYLQHTVRPQVSYPKVSPQEITEFLGLIDAYLAELATNQDDHPFVRQAITDGLKAFQFQLKHIRWAGAGYMLSAFQAVMLTYDRSRYAFESDADLDASAALKGLRSIINSVGAKLKEAREASETAKWVWEGYRALSTMSLPALALEHLPSHL